MLGTLMAPVRAIRQKMQDRERQQTHRRLIAEAGLYNDLRRATQPAARTVYPDLFGTAPPDSLDAETLAARLATVADLFRPSPALPREIAVKRRNREDDALRELEVVFVFRDSKRPTFWFRTTDGRMTLPEFHLAQYADIAALHGLIDPATHRQMVWLAIRRSHDEYSAPMDRTRIHVDTSGCWSDTREVRGYRELDTQVKDTPHAWRLLVVLIGEAEDKVQANRLLAEIRAAGLAG